MNLVNIATKAAGGIVGGMVLYNAHHVGKEVSKEHVKECCAERMTSCYIKSRRMEDRSAITSKLKDWYFRTNADWNLPDKINSVAGYVSGVFSQVANDIIPAALATGALLSKKAGKFCAIGLGLYAIKYMLCDVMDIGRKNHLE